MKNKGGRKTIFTRALGEQIVKALAAGMLMKDAAEYNGINVDSIYTWVKWGQTRKDPDLQWFAGEVPKARASAKARAVASVHGAMKKDWKAAAWWLGITDPKHYSQKVRVTLESEFTDALARIQEKLSPEVYEQVLAAIVDDGGDVGAEPDSLGETDPLH